MIYIIIAIGIIVELYAWLHPDSKINIHSQAYKDAHMKHYSVRVHNYANEYTNITVDAESSYDARKFVEENYRVTVDKVIEL